MTVSQAKRFWRDADGAIPNTLAISYALIGHLGGLYLLIQPSILSVIAGIFLTGHSLIIAAYLIHEAAHMTLFKSKKNNSRLGELLLWFAGGSYASFERIRHMHLRHHKDRADVSCFDYQKFIKQQSKLFQHSVLFLEWLYLPAVELIMHAQVIIRPFQESQLKQYRKRIIINGLSRLTFFTILFLLSPWALLGYAIAYWMMLQALFLADAFAHTYDAFFVEQQNGAIPEHDRDSKYDLKHTYSNLISTRHPWLNLLNLNFGYHNAHHARASVAWHKLPAYHNEIYGDVQHDQVLPYKELLKTIHKNRIKRIFVDDYGDVSSGSNRGDSFIGAHGVSFLSIV